MKKEKEVRREQGETYLTSWLLTLGQLATLVIVAFMLLLPASIRPNLLPAGSPYADLMVSEWPTALLIQRTFAQGHGLPLWNPYYAGGQPLIADPLAALFYPPTHLVHFLSLRHYYLVLIMGHFIFAGLGMLLLGRYSLKLSRLPALVAAISFMATPRLISHLGAGHLTILQTVAWFPWLALACWATVQNPRRWGALLGVCIGMTLLAGHPQMAYYGLLMTAALATWLLLKRWRLQGLRTLLTPIMGLAAAGVIGALLAAIQLLPLMEFTAVSTRQLSVKSGDTYPLQYFLLALIGHEKPSIFPWEGMISPGHVVLALALIAIVTRWRKAWPLALGIVLVAGLAMGNSSLFYLLVAKILPDLDLFRGLARIWFIALVPMALLAGLGTEALLLALHHLSSRTLSHLSSHITVIAGLLIAFLVAFTLLRTDAGSAQSYDVRVATTPTALAIRASQLAGSGRIYNVQANMLQVSAVELETPFADGWNPLLIESYVNYMQYAGGYTAQGYQAKIPANLSASTRPNARLLGLMHVKVVVSRRPLPDPHFVRLGKIDGTLIYKNTDDAGSGYLVKPDANGNIPSLNQLQRLPTSVQMVSPTPEQETFTFSTNTYAYFVIAMPAFPGWIANLDGHTVEIQKIAGTLVAIKVGPGTHTLSYTYSPLSLSIGATLSGLALLATFVWLIIGRRRKPGNPDDSAKGEDYPSVTDKENALNVLKP